MKESTSTSAANQGALPSQDAELEPIPNAPGMMRYRAPDPPPQAPAREPNGWDALADKEQQYLERLWESRRMGAVPFWQRELINLLALTGMTRAEFVAREVTPALLEFLRPKSRWAAGSPFGYVRMMGTQTANHNGKNKVYRKGADYGIGIDIDGEDAAQFIAGQVAEALPTLTIRILCSAWPGGIGTNIPASRLPKMKNASGVEVEAPGTMVEAAEQFSRGQLVLYVHELPRDALPNYVDHRIRNGLDFGMIEVICKGRFLDDPATLPPSPVPERKKLPEPNLTDRRAAHFRQMKASPQFGFDKTKNEFYQLPITS
jgi:hypothetical protein